MGASSLLLEEDIVGKMEKIELGTAVHISLQSSARSVSVPTTLVGRQHGKYLILEVPSQYWARLRTLPASQKLVFRFVEEGVNGEMSAFKSEIMTSTPSLRLLYVSYPSHIQVINLRKEPRMPLSMEVTVQPRKSQTYDHRVRLSGKTHDFSNSGCKIRLAKDNSGMIKAGDLIQLVFPQLKKGFSVRAQVCNLKESLEGAALGVRFIENPEIMNRFIRTVNLKANGVRQAVVQ